MFLSVKITSWKNSCKLQLSPSIQKLKIFLCCNESQCCISNLAKLMKGKCNVLFSLKKKKAGFHSLSVVLIKVMISVPLMNISHTQQKHINVSKTPTCNGISGNAPFFDVDSSMPFLLSFASSLVKPSSCLKLQNMNRVCTLRLLKKEQP